MDTVFGDLTMIRVLVSVSMLGIVTFLDLKYREIHDFWWIVFGGIAGALLIFEPQLIESLFNTGIALIVAPIVLIMWRFGIFGGADAFGFIVLAALFPMGTLSEGVISPFTTVTNAAIFAVLPLLYNVGRNTISIARGEDIFEGIDESQTKKIFAMFIGYKSKNPKFGFSIESKQGSSKKLNLSLQHSEETEFTLKQNSWISPGLPYFLFITGGFLVQLFYGDLIINLFNLA